MRPRTLTRLDESAYTVRFNATLAAKMRRWQAATHLPGTEILRMLVTQTEDIQVVCRTQERLQQEQGHA
jgi:hypothetical protein